ncbi:Chm7 protein [Saccharomycopsis crataegensis]|uniref:Chm7 protein n=1 Tax=Saccharomycopsis crataegensis TaxID=43959 RepID=A0AAV5QNN9_9ASCO|nr:Chm7 protein [Saccharomycopsis crataegensis]
MYQALVDSNSLFKKTRLRSLYSNFDQLKESNPDGYEANILAWKKLINQIIESQDGVTLDTSNLIEELSISADINNTIDARIILKPLSIDTVINEICNDPTDKKLIQLKDFNNLEKSLYDDSFLSNISVKNSLFWVLSKSGLYSTQVNVTANKEKTGNYLVGTKFVSIPKLESLKDKILSKLKSRKSSGDSTPIFTKSELLELLSEKYHFSELDSEIFLKYLSRDTNDILIQIDPIITKENEKIEIPDPVIKIKTNENVTITVEDVATAQLKANIKLTNMKINNLTVKVESYETKVQNLIKNKSTNREYLKLLLRTKKSIESALIHATSNLNNLETLLSNIQLQSGNVQVLQLLNNSKTILKDLNNELNIGKVDTLMEEISTEVGKVKEINSTLTEFNDMNNTVIDEEEIDDELAELERDEARKEQEKKKQEEFDDKDMEQNLIDRLEKLKVNKSSSRLDTTSRREKAKKKEKRTALSA